MDNHLQLIFWWIPCHSHQKFFLHNPCNRCEDHLLEILFDGTQMRSIYWEGLITKVGRLIKKYISVCISFICDWQLILMLDLKVRLGRLERRSLVLEVPNLLVLNARETLCLLSSIFTFPFKLNIKRIRNISHLYT